MKTMRERLAQALCSATSPHDGFPILGLDPDFNDRPDTPEGCDGDELSTAEVYALVDAILSELREPDEAMGAAGYELAKAPPDWPTTPAPEPTPEETFTAMIDAIRGRQ